MREPEPLIDIADVENLLAQLEPPRIDTADNEDLLAQLEPPKPKSAAAHMADALRILTQHMNRHDSRAFAKRLGMSKAARRRRMQAHNYH